MPSASRPQMMREAFRAAVKAVDGPDAELGWLSGLNLTLGYLLGAEMYYAAAAVRRAMIQCGLEPAGRTGPMLQEDADVH